jgi:hypothetical protein
MHPLVGVDQRPRGRPARLDGHAEGAGDQGRGRVVSIDQPTTRREQASRTTAQYSLPSRVGCSVMSVTQSWSRSARVNCRLTRSLAVASGRSPRRNWGRPVTPCRPARRNRQLHSVVADADAAAQGEFGMDPAAAVGLAGGGMHLIDGVGEPGVADRPGCWRPAAPGVTAGLRDVQHAAADLHREPLGGHHLDRREPSNGGACSFSSSAARP